MIRTRDAVLVIAFAALSLPARADMNQTNAGAAWRQADRCAQEALQKYPDYTPDSNAKREAARRACLRNHHLPAPSSAAAPPAEPGKF